MVHTMKISQYLFRRSGGNYYFRMRTPSVLKSKIQKNEIKFSLKTKNHTEARKRVLPYISFIARVQAMRDIDEILRQLEASGIKNTQFEIRDLQIGNVKVGSLTVDPEKDGDTDEAINFLNGIWDKEQSDIQHSPNQSTSNTTVKLQTVIGAFVDEKMLSSYSHNENPWTEKTRDENVDSYNLLLRILGEDICMSDLGYETGREVKDIIRKLPSNINKIKKFRNKTIDEIIAMNEEQRALATLNKIMGRYATLFDYAKRHQYINDNYFEKLTIKLKGNKKFKRASYSDEKLKTLFSKLNSQNPLHSYYYWIPRIALYTGLRVNEIAQLHLSDIRKEEGIYIFDINDDAPDKKLKTDSSKRWVPIHSELIGLGFLKRVEMLNKQGKTRLFEELKHTKDGYGKAVSNWFSRIRKSLNMVNLKPKLDFHSFRGTVATALQRNDIPEYRVSAILGHEADTESFARYGDGFAMSTVKSDIDSIKFNVPEIHIPAPEFRKKYGR